MAVRKLKINYYGFFGFLGFYGFKDPWFFCFFLFFLFFLVPPQKPQPAGADKLAEFNSARDERAKENKEKILKSIEIQKSINNDSAQSLLGVSDATATRYLDELERDGKIKQIGNSGRGVFYEKV